MMLQNLMQFGNLEYKLRRPLKMPAAREKDKSRRKVDEEEIGKYLNNVISGLVHKK